MAAVQESFGYKSMAASGLICGPQGCIGGFLCVAPGTVALSEGATGTGNVIVSAMPVVAGVFYPMPFGIGNYAYATLGSGATGTFAYL